MSKIHEDWLTEVDRELVATGHPPASTVHHPNESRQHLLENAMQGWPASKVAVGIICNRELRGMGY